MQNKLRECSWNFKEMYTGTQKAPENPFLSICSHSTDCVFCFKMDEYLDLVCSRHHGHARSGERAAQRQEQTRGGTRRDVPPPRPSHVLGQPEDTGHRRMGTHTLSSGFIFSLPVTRVRNYSSNKCRLIFKVRVTAFSRLSPEVLPKSHLARLFCWYVIDWMTFLL